MDNCLKNKIIILIDSNGEINQQISNPLKQLGIDIHLFTSGTEALEHALKIFPHLIMTDFITEDLNGKALFLKLTQEAKYRKIRQIPFIIFSNSDVLDELGEQLYKLGLRGWFIKPFGTHEITEIIKNIFMAYEVFQRNRELQREVRRSEFRYRDLLENANDLIFTLDENGELVYLNNRFQALTGFLKEDWLEKKLIELFKPEDQINIINHYQMIHTGKARVFVAEVINRLREPLILSFNMTPIFEKGKIIGVMGIGRDVTEQKQMEKELLTLKNFNESIIQSMEGGLLTIDLQGQITSLNNGGERILEIKEKEVVGKNIEAILKPIQVKKILSESTPPGVLSLSREIEIIVSSGKSIFMGFTTTDRIDTQGQKVGTIISFRDITQLKQMQSEVLRMDRLASLGVLASGIAHEIKNPLAGIKTLAQACEDEFEKDDTRREYLIRIIRQVNRLNDLLKTFFTYARPKKPDRKPHELSGIIREVMNLVSKKLSNTGIQYIEKVNNRIPKVLVDFQQMQQIFLNLIMNAIDAMPNGGKLTVVAKRITNPVNGIIRNQRSEKYSKRKAYIEVRITDSGEGISSEKVQTVFDPFYTTKASGLGLGLSIVYRIIEEHHGDIYVKSKKNQGTTFCLLIPTGDDV